MLVGWMSKVHQCIKSASKAKKKKILGEFKHLIKQFEIFKSITEDSRS